MKSNFSTLHKTIFYRHFKQATGLLLLFMVQSCKQTVTYNETLSADRLIPVPVSVVSRQGAAFEITASTTIYTDKNSPELTATGEYLAGLLRASTGFRIPVQPLENQQKPTESICLSINDENAVNQEFYTLSIDKKSVILEAAKPEGIFRGVQTLRQLLPPEIEKPSPQQGPWLIPAGKITDYPQYAYRGMMLDVSRHFFGVQEVKRLINLIAAYKINTLHLHLSDDQGWRIEIKSWPKLATYGGSTQVGGGKGGYYTQEDYKEIVAYAQERYITIIPEIDMPGHTNAALASYPELNCDGKARELYTGIKVGFSSLCTDKEITYQFVEDVVAELAALTPGPYIHIGGDESHATDKEDYKVFIGRVQDIVKKHGKIMIGWDEVQHAGLHPESIAQFWDSRENALGAVKQRVKIIMSPANKIYLDMKYDSVTPLGLKWAGYIEADTGYDWNPATLVEGISKEDILGIEAPLWTETVTMMDDIEYMVFPRLPGYAEISWSQDTLRNWVSYKERLSRHYKRFKAMDIHFYESGKVPWKR